MGNKNKLPDVFNPDQLVQLMDSIDRPKVAIAVALGFFCGMRISEICNLKMENIDLEKKRLKVVDSKFSMRIKTGYGKDRYIVIPDQMINPLKKWKDMMNGGKWFIQSHKSPDLPMRKKSLGEQYRQALDKAGLLIADYDLKFKQKIFGKVKEKKVTRYKYKFHTLRHSYATYLRDKGVDIYTISRLLGHAQVTTTQIYARVSDTQLYKAVNQAFNHQMRAEIIPPETVQRMRYPQGNQSPMQFLQMQVLRGEIDKEEFREKVALLQESQTAQIEQK